MLQNENTIYFVKFGCVTLGVLLQIPCQVVVDLLRLPGSAAQAVTRCRERAGLPQGCAGAVLVAPALPQGRCLFPAPPFLP